MIISEISIKIPPKSNSDDIYKTDKDIDIIIFTYCFDSYNWVNKNLAINEAIAIDMPLSKNDFDI